ncbi:DUF1254 domain-containing protein [Phenylobacterium sp. J367]|uniref:DUF1254 domain-containing protein n=1 Tax=Phenylobacterium sp. J367 TaxID=2898435 RepID=UPI0021511140|nr:DUF1254 domain-containing protein [Phenylobacterium sp. J367]MCR5878825.1 DUF1214 domain-containing protein [Phenylobacterium sp. J367]
MAQKIFRERGSNSIRTAAAGCLSICFPLFLVDAVRRAHPLAMQQFALLPPDGAGLAPGLQEDDACIVQTSAWIDLSRGPVVAHLPHAHGRHFDLTLIDTAGEPFASFGSRTGDDTGFDLVLVGPRWSGEAPRDVVARRSPSEACWAIGRLHAHSALDRSDTIALARRQSLAPLAERNEPRSAPVRTLEPPASSCLRQVAELGPALFFHRLDAVLDRAPVPFQRAARPKLEDFRRELGGPPPPGDWDEAFAHDLAQGLDDGLAAVQAAAEAVVESHGSGWRAQAVPVHDGSGASLAQAGRAYANLGAPTREELITLTCDHDELGAPLRGDLGSRIHFEADALPPVHAFWRLCTRPAASPDKRYGLSNHSDLLLNADGSLDLLIQNAPPPTGAMANWLPAPAGPLTLAMRLYAPRAAALGGGWRMPPVQGSDADPVPARPRRSRPQPSRPGARERHYRPASAERRPIL